MCIDTCTHTGLYTYTYAKHTVYRVQIFYIEMNRLQQSRGQADAGRHTIVENGTAAIKSTFVKLLKFYCSMRICPPVKQSHKYQIAHIQFDRN